MSVVPREISAASEDSTVRQQRSQIVVTMRCIVAAVLAIFALANVSVCAENEI